MNYLRWFFILTAFLLLVSLLLPISVNALSIPGFGGSFGGRILTVIPCTCSASLLLIVGPPKGGSFIYRPGVSTLYRNYRLTPGNWALGNSSGRDVCLTGVPPFCVPAGNGPIIRRMGTS